MESKILVSDAVCHDEVVDYIASRYSITPRQVISHFMRQDGVIKDPPDDNERKLSFEENEMAILRDMGICPSCIEFI